MGYTVAHVDKTKSGSSGGLTEHIDRTQEPDKVSKNIDPEKTPDNFELVERTGTIDHLINERIEKGYKLEKAIRKDAVTSCRYILSGSHEDMKSMSQGKLKSWALDNYEYFADMYGEENIIRATVHMDEKTPHMHLIVVPLTPEGKLSAKEYIGNKKKLKEFQTDYANKVGAKYNLKRGIEDTNRKHLTTKDFYRNINKNELTAEEIINNPRAKELITKLIELSDVNKDLLKEVAHKKIREHELKGHNEGSGIQRKNPRIDKGNSFKIGR
jgi:hypothetical protein